MVAREQSGDIPSSGWNRWSAALVLGATLLAYLPALAGGFVWDDDGYLTKPALRSLAGLGRIWFDLRATEQYYPLLHSAFWVEHRLWGGAPFGYHLVNVLLHAASACLLALVLIEVGRLGPRSDPSGSGAARGTGFGRTAAPTAAFLFALHPVGVESVAWIAEQKNTLSTFFYLAAGWAYLRSRGRPEGRGLGLYLLATLLFACAILSKSVAATLPAALLVVLWWREGRRSWRRDGVWLAPWAGLGGAAGLVTGWVESRLMGAHGPEFSFSAIERTLIAGRASWFYFGKLAWPFDLVFIYPRWRVDPGSWWQYLFPLAVVLLLAVLWARRRRSRGPLAVALLFLGTLFPTLGFLNVYAFIFSYVADHWQYLASLAIFAGAAVCLGRWEESLPSKNRCRAAALAVLAALGVLTWRQCRNYRSAQALYESILRRNPEAWMAHNNLGMVLEGLGRRAEARAHYEAAVRLRPTDAEAHNNLAILLAGDGHYPEAIAHYREALRIEPGRPEMLNNLGNALTAAGSYPEAIARFRQAVTLQPEYAVAWDDLGIALAGAGRLEEAAGADARALALAPRFPEAENHLGNALRGMHREPEAMAHYGEAVRLRPDFPEARNNLGDLLLAAGRKAEALAQYGEAVRLRPNYLEARCSLGNLLADSGRLPEAAEQFAAAVRLQPHNAEIHNTLGCAYAAMDRRAEARREFAEARRLEPDNAEVRANLLRLDALP